jgi:polyisoprenoid-binding protein YceI
MNRSFGLLALAVVLVVGGGAAWWFSQCNEAPSVDVTAPPVESTATSVEGTSPTSAPNGPDEAESAVRYALTDGSRAIFTLDEELRGTPATVVGTSTIVLGEMLFDPSDAASLQIGTILVNARDFMTDSGNRNRAIRGPILDADTFEFIEFTPTSIDGLDGTGSSFTVTGDLKIRDVINPATFEVTASLEGEVVTGTATAVVDRTQWGLDIPNAPGVANVSESVTLVLEFTAAPTT